MRRRKTTLRRKLGFRGDQSRCLVHADFASARSSITFLRSGDHDDEAVKAAAIAMRHSSKTAASAAYDKGASDRRVSAAMKVAADYSAKFTAGASSSTDNQ